MTAPERGFTIGGLGEIAIRCRDLEAMTRFYGEIIGLPRLVGPHRGGIVFFRVADGHAGHTAILALFEDEAFAPSTAPDALGALHHLAFSVRFEELDAVTRWYDAQGLDHRTVDFAWTGWRGVFTRDPEGNTVEIVARNPGVADPPARIQRMDT